MRVKLLVDGGDMKPGPAVAQQIGPLGINLGKVISDVNQATLNFKGIKVPVEIDVDSKTKSYAIKVSSPPVAELIKKELGIEKGSGTHATLKVGNLAFERAVALAKSKYTHLLAKDMKAAVKLVVGSCVSLGALIDNKEAKEIEKDIDAGKYDSEIAQEITQPSPEKAKQLKEFFVVLKEKQDRALKAAAEAKAAEEAAKAAAATAAPSPGAPAAAGAATPPQAAGAKTEAKKEEAKKEEKKKK